MINSLFSVVLSDDEVFGFVTRLFDKDPPTTRPATVPAPYYSDLTRVFPQDLARVFPNSRTASSTAKRWCAALQPPPHQC
jgi:hypothetical protein